MMGLAGEWLPEPERVSGPTRPRRETEVKEPSDMIAIGDTPITRGGPGSFWEGRVFGFADIGFSGPGVGSVAYELHFNQPYDPVFKVERELRKRRHGGLWNVVFLDAHVESLKTAQLYDVRQDRVMQRWNVDHLPHREQLGNPWGR